MENNINILLLGGNGFIGKGLQRELKNRDIQYKSLDIEDIDLSKSKNIRELSFIIEEYSHIVLLASLIGVDLFNNLPEYASFINKKIYQNFISSLVLNKRNKNLDITYYSSSELFWNLKTINEIITDSSEYKFDFSNKRNLYSQIKYQAECELKNLQNKSTIIKNLKILRPFNISGYGQRRGVVYEMIKSAIFNKKIVFSKNTTRTITDIDIASKNSVDFILENRNLSKNIVDPDCSLYIETLAEFIKKSLNDNSIELIEKEEDSAIQYRHVSKVNENLDLAYKKINKITFDIINENNWK